MVNRDVFLTPRTKQIKVVNQVINKYEGDLDECCQLTEKFSDFIKTCESNIDYTDRSLSRRTNKNNILSLYPSESFSFNNLNDCNSPGKNPDFTYQKLAEGVNKSEKLATALLDIEHVILQNRVSAITDDDDDYNDDLKRNKASIVWSPDEYTHTPITDKLIKRSHLLAKQRSLRHYLSTVAQSRKSIPK